MMQEGPEESIFDPTEAQDCNRAFMQQIYITEEDNQINAINSEGNLLVILSRKILILWKTIWPLFVALESQLITSMILNHRTSLNSKRKNKLGRCSIARETTIIIISLIDGTKHKRRCCRRAS